MEGDMLKTARAENSPTGPSQRVGSLSAPESGARLLPPTEAQAAAESGSNRSVGAGDEDAFAAGKARAALYRSHAGCHDSEDSSDSDRDFTDVDALQRPPFCLSST